MNVLKLHLVPSRSDEEDTPVTIEQRVEWYALELVVAGRPPRDAVRLAWELARELQSQGVLLPYSQRPDSPRR